MLMVETSESPGFNVTGSFWIKEGSNQFRTDVPRYIELYKQGRLKLDELMSNRIALDDVNEGFEALGRGEVTRNVIVFDV